MSGVPLYHTAHVCLERDAKRLTAEVLDRQLDHQTVYFETVLRTRRAPPYGRCEAEGDMREAEGDRERLGREVARSDRLDYSRVDMLPSRYKFVNFGAGKIQIGASGYRGVDL